MHMLKFETLASAAGDEFNWRAGATVDLTKDQFQRLAPTRTVRPAPGVEVPKSWYPDAPAQSEPEAETAASSTSKDSGATAAAKATTTGDQSKK